MSHFATFFVLLLMIAAAFTKTNAEVAAPEIFEEFINGWVDYDDGAYASALRAFARAHSLNPEFAPAVGGMQASLVQMNMPEIADAVGYRGRKITKKIVYQPALAFWGIYSESNFQLEGAEPLERQIVELLKTNVNLPIHLVSPGSQSWHDRQSMIPAQYNLMALLSTDEDSGEILLRFHLIEQLDVSQGNSLDLLATNTPSAWTVQHRAWTLQLPKTQFIDGLKNPEVIEELTGLLFGEWQNADAPFHIDSETANLPDFADLNTPWEIFSKAAISGTPKAEWFCQAKKNVNTQHPFPRHVYHSGFLRWILIHSAADDPLRPWLLAYDLGSEHTIMRAHVLPPEEVREELLQRYPNHPVTKILRFNEIIRILSPGNIDAYLPELHQMLDDFLAYNEQRSISSHSIRSLRSIKEILNHFSDPSQPINFPNSIDRLGLNEIKVIISRKSVPYFCAIDRLGARKLLTQPSEIPDEKQWAKEVQFMLQLNPYLSEHETLLNPTLISLLQKNPDSAYLNTTLRWQLVGNSHQVNRIQQELDFDYQGHWAHLLATKKRAAGLAEFMRYLPSSQEQKQLLCEAFATRLLSSSSEEILEETHHLYPIMSATKIKLIDLPIEAQNKWLNAFRDATPYTREHTYSRFMALCERSGKFDFIRNNILNNMDENLAYIANDSSPLNFLTNSHELASLLIATGEHEAAGQIIHLALGKVSDHHFVKGSRERVFWMHLWITHAEQLFLSGAPEQALAEIDSFLKELDGENMVYYGSNRPIGKHALNLKRRILEATQGRP